MTTARVPCEAIKRYPVVARWRNDVDYVAAGIYCFQPYCVTGELDPPANPLICPQFCVRFNDLDNIQYIKYIASLNSESTHAYWFDRPSLQWVYHDGHSGVQLPRQVRVLQG